jgi:Leucine-rich repeat (LRR) protein
MKTTLLFLSVFLSASLFGQNVNIPDADFKAYLVENPEINTNNDTEIQLSEATAFTGKIDLTHLGITDLTGIEAFTALTYLDCRYNELTSLDVSKNTALTELYCYENQLTCVKGLPDGLKKADLKKCD